MQKNCLQVTAFTRKSRKYNSYKGTVGKVAKKLIHRQVLEIFYDRGIEVGHTTVYRWVQEYSQVIYCLWKKRNRKAGDSWRMDETYIKVKGKQYYLYRAIYSSGVTLNICLRKKSDSQATYTFFKRLIKKFGEPRVLATDNARSLACAFKRLKSDVFLSPRFIEPVNT